MNRQTEAAHIQTAVVAPNQPDTMGVRQDEDGGAVHIEPKEFQESLSPWKTLMLLANRIRADLSERNESLKYALKRHPFMETGKEPADLRHLWPSSPTSMEEPNTTPPLKKNVDVNKRK